MSMEGGGGGIFWARALQNWKSKEKGALTLSKGTLVKVLSGSADGEKYFGEAGKKSGWFPQIYVKRESGSVVQAFRAGDGEEAPVVSSPAISGPGHVRKNSHNIESLSQLAEDLPPTALADLAKSGEHAAVPSSEEPNEGSGSRILKRSVTVNLLRQSADKVSTDTSRQSADQSNESVSARPGEDLSIDKLTEEQNAAIARLRKNRTLPHLRPPMPSLHSPVSSAFGHNPTAPVSPRSAGARPGGLRLANGPTSLSLNSLPLNGGSASPASPRSRIMSSYTPSSQPSSPTTSTTPPSPSSISSTLESPRRTRSSSNAHSAPHLAITSIFPQRSISSESHHTIPVSGTMPSPLSRISSASNSRRQSKPGGKDEKKKKKEEKEKRDGSRRKANPKKSSSSKRQASGTIREVFGVSLEEIMRRQRLDHPHLQVPIVLLNCAHAIILLDGHKTEGIFRISGNAQSLEGLKDTIREHEYADDFQDAHNAASLLKLWLSSLSSPLIPDQLAKKCLESVDEPEKSVQIVKEMPDINQKTLSYVVQFLQQYILPEKAVTKMDEDNVAMTLAPVIFSQNGSIGDMAEILKQTQLQKVFVVNLLQHMKFETPLSWTDFEEAIEVINIKTAASQQMALELKKKGKTGGLIGGLVKPFSPGDKLSKDGAQFNTYYTSSTGLGSPRYVEDLSSSGSNAALLEEPGDEAGIASGELSESAEDEDELYEFG